MLPGMGERYLPYSFMIDEIEGDGSSRPPLENGDGEWPTGPYSTEFRVEEAMVRDAASVGAGHPSVRHSRGTVFEELDRGDRATAPGIDAMSEHPEGDRRDE